MTRATLIAVLAIALLAGCSRSGDATYAFTIVKGANNIPDVVVKMNTSTGQSWARGPSTVFMPVADPNPPSSGTFRLLEWDAPQPDGTWEIYRVDVDSGHTWSLIQQGSNFNWLDVKTASQ